MIDWATQTKAAGQTVEELQPEPTAIDIAETISNIRRILREQEDLLPDDILEAEARRQAGTAQAPEAVAATPRRALLGALWPRRG